jgi:Ca2+-binding EF-hand superfamily protein
MDGRVSKEEFTGPSEIFERFDKNNDGYIDMNEVPR